MHGHVGRLEKSSQKSRNPVHSTGLTAVRELDVLMKIQVETRTKMGIFLSKKKEAKQKRPAEGLMKQSKAILGVSHMISIVLPSSAFLIL